MTLSNKRRVAHFRSAFLGASALAGFALATSPASAIIINNAFTPGQVVDTTNVNGVAQMIVDEQNGFIGLCTATLINPRTVIFAAHCVNENPAGNGFQNPAAYGAIFGAGHLPIGFGFNLNNDVVGNSARRNWLNGVNGGPKDQTDVANNFYNANFVAYNPNSTGLGLGLNFLQSDVALAGLDTPAVGIPTWTTLFSPLSGPVHATLTGYGTNGTAASPSQGIDFRRRVAENIVSFLGSLDDRDNFLFGGPDGLPANLYQLDFNDPKFGTAQANIFDFNIFHDLATPKEGTTGPGDSGGPLIIDHAFAKPTVAAVLSGGSRFFGPQPFGAYGTTSFYQPLYLYWDWIVANNPYKYVSAKAGNGSWTDPAHWVMNLDPAYVTIVNGQLVNALPTTPAKGQADVAPGFGEVCYFDICQDITTGNVTFPTPPPGPNPTMQNDLGRIAKDGLDNESLPAQLPTDSAGGVAPGLDGPIETAEASPPEGSAVVAGQTIQGAPGSSNFVPNDTDGNGSLNPATYLPARYYDVTLSASGTTTLAGAAITIDRLTVNGAATGLTIASGASLRSLIDTTVFAGTFQVDGSYSSVGDFALMGGVLTGKGTVTAPHLTSVIGMIAPGTAGTVGTLSVNGNVILSSGSTLLVDKSTTGTDLLSVTGTLNAGGSVVFAPVGGFVPHFGDSGVIASAASITGAFGNVVDTLPGVLKPTVSVVTAPGGQQAILSIAAQSFTTQFTPTSTDQSQIAAALDAARADHFNDLFALYAAIDPLTDGALSQALENLAPDAERALNEIGDMQTLGFSGLLWQQLGEIGGGDDGSHASGFHVSTGNLKLALSSISDTSPQAQQFVAFGMGIASNPGAGSDAVPTGSPVASAESSDSWIALPDGSGGFLSGSSLNGSVVIGGGGSKADVRGFVIAAGINRPVDDGLVIGGSFGISQSTATLRAAPATLQVGSVQGALYARYDWADNWILEGFASMGSQAIQTRRAVVVGGTTFVLSGHTSGSSPTFGAYLGKTLTMPVGDGGTLSLVPSASLQYLRSTISPFTETGGPAAMSFAGFSEESTLARIGADARSTFEIGSMHVTPAVHASWVNNLAGRNGSIQAAFAGAPASIMTFAIAAHDAQWAELGFGADFDLGAMMGASTTLTARYDATVGRDDMQYGAWTGRLSVKF